MIYMIQTFNSMMNFIKFILVKMLLRGVTFYILYQTSLCQLILSHLYIYTLISKGQGNNTIVKKWVK
jgi:hypothetical protein